MIDIKSENGVRHIVFNRPQRKNAFTVEMYETIVEGMVTADSDPETRVILFSGVGGAFTAGNDLGDFMERPPTGEDAPVFQMLRALVEIETPMVAAVSGPAIGVGTTMLLHCDLTYAADNTRFQMPFVNLGVVPEAGSSVLLPKIAGRAKASELLLLGRPFSAAEAYEIGLINQICTVDDVLDIAMKAAQTIAQQPAEALKITRALLRDATRAETLARVQMEADLFRKRLQSAETQAILGKMLKR